MRDLGGVDDVLFVLIRGSDLLGESVVPGLVNSHHATGVTPITTCCRRHPDSWDPQAFRAGRIPYHLHRNQLSYNTAATIEPWSLASLDGSHQGFPHEPRNPFECSVDVLYVKPNSAWHGWYIFLSTLSSLVGLGAWWSEKVYRSTRASDARLLRQAEIFIFIIG